MKKLVHCLFKEYGIKNNFLVKLISYIFKTTFFQKVSPQRAFVTTRKMTVLAFVRFFSCMNPNMCNHIILSFHFFTAKWTPEIMWTKSDGFILQKTNEKNWRDICIFWYEYRIFLFSRTFKSYTFLFKKKDNIQNKPKEEFTEYYFPIMALQNYYLDYYIHTATTDQIALYKVPQAGY